MVGCVNGPGKKNLSYLLFPSAVSRDLHTNGSDVKNLPSPPYPLSPLLSLSLPPRKKELRLRRRKRTEEWEGC